MQMGYAMPILPGKTGRIRELAKEYEDHKARYEELNADATVTRHTVWLQETPMGDLEVSIMEVDDPTKMRLHFGDDEYDKWWRELVKDTHGFDPEEVADSYELPAQLLDNARGGAGPDRCTAFAIPIVPGKTEAAKELAAAVNGEKAAEHRDLLDRAGLVGENWFLQQTPGGDLMVVYFEADDVAKAFEVFADMTDDYAAWFKSELLEVTGINWEEPAPPPPDVVFDWRS